MEVGHSLGEGFRGVGAGEEEPIKGGEAGERGVEGGVAGGRGQGDGGDEDGLEAEGFELRGEGGGLLTGARDEDALWRAGGHLWRS